MDRAAEVLLVDLRLAWPVLVRAVFAVALGLVALIWPDITAVALPVVVGIWALVTGVVEIHPRGPAAPRAAPGRIVGGGRTALGGGRRAGSGVTGPRRAGAGGTDRGVRRGVRLRARGAGAGAAQRRKLPDHRTFFGPAPP
ncbi:DUF308 domain-containing protein [Pseudonocardia sp.]|jgi:hypothetical protein|uniref:DUF308 domain-containing protein n=1 Tax=Pseudonocardia sp. TaxID=60912 RepID=UPI0026179B23|nr:DUF308 domain-containing protein [Pseudonocardia sp.]